VSGALFVRSLVCAWVVAGCGFPRPPPLVVDDGGVDGPVDAVPVDAVPLDSTATDASPSCTPNQVRCDGNDLRRCNAEGTAEATTTCALGCNVAEPRCVDVNPSNGLAALLDMTASEPDLDLGESATIDTNSGTVMVDGSSVVVKSTTIVQTSAPPLRVFIVRSVTAADVKITGSNAFALVSNGDVHVGAVFAASAVGFAAGPGGFNSGACRGGDQVVIARGLSGAGGGGFGLSGGKGGTAVNGNGTAPGGAAGSATGNATLVPLRGGCDGGKVGGTFAGGGGAIQLVSRTAIVVSGVVAANGSGITGGGSGGGILLEAPRIDVSGGVVANGGGGAGGCIGPLAGESGRLDAMPASAGVGCSASGGVDGGSGGAGNTGATNGVSISMPGDSNAYAGFGGGGVGRIRVNTAPGGLHTTGLFSPNPSTGALATR